jgi:hypothetical protein
LDYWQFIQIIKSEQQALYYLSGTEGTFLSTSRGSAALNAIELEMLASTGLAARSKAGTKPGLETAAAGDSHGAEADGGGADGLAVVLLAKDGRGAACGGPSVAAAAGTVAGKWKEAAGTLL